MINDLRSDHTCSKFFRDFLDMVQRDMLIVEQNNSDDERIGRKCSHKIAVELSSMVQKCRTITEYLTVCPIASDAGSVAAKKLIM